MGRLRKLWRDHQLFSIITIATVVLLAVGTWATWFEYSHNEQGFPEGHYAFWSKTFAAYWVMQLVMNFVPELLGILVLLAGAAKLRERWESSA
jgi:hypothetical protein